MPILAAILLLSVNLSGQWGEDHFVKCGLSQRHRQPFARATALFARPTMQAVHYSSDGAFAVHYDTTGRHSPILDPRTPGGPPDWVMFVAEALAHSRDLLIEQGFRPAPDDGDGSYDVFLVDTLAQGYYGIIEPDGWDNEGQLVSYIAMDNDFAADELFYTHGIDAARVTAAHEYFHAVQMGYKPANSDIFFYELSSTWFEDLAFPEVNDWIFWFKGGGNAFGNKPTQSLASSDGYSLAIFGHYLIQTYGHEIMLRSWERFESMNALAAFKAVVASFQSNLTVAWTDFVARLFFNGREPSHYFYPDQDLMTPPEAGEAQLLMGASNLVFNNLVPAAAGIQALALDGPANLELWVATAPPVYSARMVLGREDNRFSSLILTGGPWYEADLNSLSTIVLVVGGESGSIEIEATAVDTLPGLAFALDFLGPNPLVPGRPTHSGLTLRYTVGQALPQGDHRITIYNILGQRLPLGDNLYHWQKIMPVGEGSHDLFLDLPLMRQWPSGVYILRFTLDRRHIFTRTFTILR